MVENLGVLIISCLMKNEHMMTKKNVHIKKGTKRRYFTLTPEITVFYGNGNLTTCSD